MTGTRERHEATAQESAALFAHPGVDVATLALCALMWGGLVLNLLWAVGQFGAPPPAWVSVALGVCCLNLSFTVWHEGVHDNVFRARLGNDVVGVLGAFPAMLPYFMIRRNHHLHHEHTNDPELDPDVWFLQGSIWTLPLRYPAGVARARRRVAATNPPRWEGVLDRLMLLLVPALLALGWYGGWIWPLVWCWVVPKLVAMWIHAWYVNWLPHHGLPAERFRDTRIFPLGWLSPLMLCHNYHGLHHAWQSVAWHRYPAAFRAKRELLEKRGTPIRTELSAR
ncbi:MAG: hypothetical protein EPO68_11210 [Planctomycetota bacterium]|nr:MAG: hypothetical protein EPO68_11210 [Planctomycetota bacterium]